MEKLTKKEGIWYVERTCHNCGKLNLQKIVGPIANAMDCSECGLTLPVRRIKIPSEEIAKRVALNHQVRSHHNRSGGSLASMLGIISGIAGAAGLAGMGINILNIPEEEFPGSIQTAPFPPSTPHNNLCIAMIYFVNNLELEEPYDGDATEVFTDIFRQYLCNVDPSPTRVTLPMCDKTKDITDSITSFASALRKNAGIPLLEDDAVKDLIVLFQFLMDNKNGNLSKSEIEKGYKTWPILNNVG